jgi:hypothetical protein
MDELECMKIIDEGLQAVPEEATRARIASWVASKYGGVQISRGTDLGRGASVSSGVAIAGDVAKNGEVAGIAKLSQSGEVLLTVRDFKAKSANDAAIRLVHVLIWVTGKLAGRPAVSSKNEVVPLLRKYRLYDGNTRGVIAKDKGLVRDGDELSLDFHAEQLAEKFVNDILDGSIEGRWKPGGSKRRSSKSSGETPAASA